MNAETVRRVDSVIGPFNQIVFFRFLVQYGDDALHRLHDLYNRKS